MGDVSDWADLCSQTIIWQSFVKRDQYGAPQYLAGQSFTGRRVFKTQRVNVTVPQGSQGQGSEVVAESTIWILGIPSVRYEDILYVQGDVAPYPPILTIERIPDEDGDLFVKVTMGSSNG